MSFLRNNECLVVVEVTLRRFVFRHCSKRKSWMFLCAIIIVAVFLEVLNHRNLPTRTNLPETPKAYVRKPSSLPTPSVCIVGNVPMSSLETGTPAFVRARMVFLRDAALRSFQHAYQCEDSTENPIKSFQIVVPITGWEHHFDSWNAVEQFFELGHNHTLMTTVAAGSNSNCATNITVLMQPTAVEDAKAALAAQKNDGCDWVMVTRLDADDILMPGYFNFVLNKVIRDTLVATKTAAGDTWLGALVTARYLPGVAWVDGRCQAIKAGSLPEEGFQGGSSQGQTKVYRRDVHKALGSPVSCGNHVYELGQLRTMVAQQYLNLTTYKTPFDRVYDAKLDAPDEAVTRIKTFETTLSGFGTTAAYMKTPLSGSLKWKDTLSMPVCTFQAWQEATAEYIPGSLDFLYNSSAMQVLGSISVLDVCQSNSFFLKFNKGRWGKDADTCEAIEQAWQRFKKQNS